MNIYDTTQIELDIDRIAEANDGEIPEDKLQELVLAQTQSIVQIGKLCRYIMHLKMFIKTAKEEKARINAIQKKAEIRMESIERYLTPYVAERGKFDAETFSLSIRKSSSVELEEDFVYNLTGEELVEYCTKEVIYYPDKNKIKDALEKNIKIKGAKLTPHDNLQIK